MPDPVKDSTPPKTLPRRFYKWFNERTGINSVMHASLDEPVPGGARLAYVFGSGLLFIFISQVITGLCLALYYVPSAESAHTSVAYITKQVAAGQFLRSLHYYGSSAMIIVLLLHFLQTFIYGSFKGRRELLWISGAILSFLVLGMGFTGYLLPWDQSAYFATAVGTNIVGEVPFIGQWLTSMLRGGDTLGTLTLSRFYFAHVFLIPAMIFVFIGVHIALFRKAGAAGPINEDPIHPKLPPESFYPRQVIMDMAFAMLIMVGLGFLAYFHPVQLGPLADPANTKFVPRPEWYYLPMFEWLKFWPSRMEVFAVIFVPAALALAFFLMPFLDRKLERRPWRRPIPLLAVAIVLVGMIFLGFKSHLDDLHDHNVAVQLAFQKKQAEQYTKAPFIPRMESASGAAVPSGPVSPLVAKGKGIFTAQGCSGCHGATGTGTANAPSLVGITAKYPLPKITALLHHPNAKMLAGHMPSFDLSTPDMAALFSYLGSLGKGGGGAPAGTSAAAPTTSTPAPATPAAESTTNSTGPAKGATATSAAAAAGEKIFQAQSCARCHGEAGAGAGNIPPLKSLIAKRSDAQLEKLIQAPDATMKAGGMPPLVAPANEVSAVVAYLRSLAPGKNAHPQSKSSRATTAGHAKVEAAIAKKPAAKSGTAKSAATPASPASAKQKAPAVKEHALAGRVIFVADGCSACHGNNAQGTHFAPSLINITKKYPPAQLTNLLHHPKKAMRAGGMPPVTVNDAQMKQLVTYLSQLGSMPAKAPATAGQSKKSASGRSAKSLGGSVATTAEAPKSAKKAPLSAEALRGKAVFQRNRCETCHGVDGLNGTVAAPGLAGMASKLPASVLDNLLQHHSTQMKNGNMPPTNMNASTRKALIAYIRSMPSPSDAK
ncbi:MAG TPA: c-type cytochrome [Acidobacteriaceae bacterium]|nr:c-type cytochrome [Acidobacteriaceae bacterium]